MKIDFSKLEKMDRDNGAKLLVNNGYGRLALQRDPPTEEYIEPFILYDDSDPEDEDPDIAHLVYYSSYRQPNSNEPDKMELWHWWEDSRYLV